MPRSRSSNDFRRLQIADWCHVIHGLRELHQPSHRLAVERTLSEALRDPVLAMGRKLKNEPDQISLSEEKDSIGPSGVELLTGVQILGVK
jgi:predicted RNase H-like nuclease